MAEREDLTDLEREVFDQLAKIRGCDRMSLQDLIRICEPGKSKAADHEGSRSAAIHEYCKVCSGGSPKQAAECETYSCFLWPFRPGNGPKVRPPGQVPTVAEYARLLEAKRSDAQRAYAASLRKGAEDE